MEIYKYICGSESLEGKNELPPKELEEVLCISKPKLCYLKDRLCLTTPDVCGIKERHD